MRVALGTIEIDEDTRRKLGRAIQNNSYLKRDQAREWALGLIHKELEGVRKADNGATTDDDDETVVPKPAEKDKKPNGFLPEPPATPEQPI